MTKPVIVCLGPALRQLLERETGVELHEIPACKGNRLLEIRGAGEDGKGKTRPPSEYNRLIGTCMRSGESMKACASGWRKKKE